MEKQTFKYLQSEIDCLKKINHENVVKYIDDFEENG